jgi:hypothetical protein
MCQLGSVLGIVRLLGTVGMFETIKKDLLQKIEKKQASQDGKAC